MWFAIAETASAAKAELIASHPLSSIRDTLDNLLRLIASFCLAVAVLLLLAASSTALAQAVKVGGGPATVKVEGVSNVNVVTIDTKDTNKKIKKIQILVPTGKEVIQFPDDSTHSKTQVAIGTLLTIDVPPGPKKTQNFKTTGSMLDTAIDVFVTYDDDTTASGSPTVKEPSKSKPADLNPTKLTITSTSGNTITFDATTGALTFTDDVVTGTGFPGDPLVGANVIMPSYNLLGPSADGSSIVFTTTSDEGFLRLQIGATDVMFEAAAPFLFYSIADNEFSVALSLLGLAGAGAGTAFFDSGLSTLSSPSLTVLNSELNPGDADFLPDIPLAMSFMPSFNFFAITNHFNASGGSAFENLIFQTVPEPASIWMLASGLVALVALRSRRIRYVSGTH